MSANESNLTHAHPHYTTIIASAAWRRPKVGQQPAKPCALL